MIFVLACTHAVDIAITAADVAPAMANAAPWDGPDGKSAGSALNLLSGALSQVDPSGQLGAALVGTASSMTLPDVAGTATFDPGDGTAPSTLALPVVNDSLAPAWSGPTFTAVALGPKARLSVVFVDEDLQSDDPVGTVTLGSAELMRAKASGEPTTFTVADQTSGQLLGVTVRVTATTTPTP